MQSELFKDDYRQILDMSDDGNVNFLNNISSNHGLYTKIVNSILLLNNDRVEVLNSKKKN